MTTDKLTTLGNEAQAAINDAMTAQKAIDGIAIDGLIKAARAVAASYDIEEPLVPDDEFDRRLVALREALRALESEAES